MTKRIFALLLCLVTVLALLPVPANAATTLKILKQPQNCYVQLGEKIRVPVSAQGDDLVYQWYYRDTNSKTFKKSTSTTNTYRSTMTQARSGRQVYCVIKDKYGNSVKTNTVVCKIPNYATITKQPATCRVAFGNTAKTSVTATGDGLTYQWYYRNAGDTAFSKSSTTSATYSVKMDTSRAGRYLYCVIKDAYGKSVTTNTVRILASSSFKSSKYDVALNKTKSLASQLNFSTAEGIKWTSSDPAIATVSSSGVVTGLQKGTVTITALGKVTRTKATCKVEVGHTKMIALTFDDGPSTHTARLLDYLEENTDVKVTFFMVGNRINSYKTSVKRVAEQGHEIGYHSYDHSTQTNLASSTITSHYQKSNKILKDLTGKSFTLWRTPGGSYNQRVLDCVPLPHIYWSVDTLDWKYRNATTVYNAIMNNAKDGAIVLLHDLHGTSVDGAIKAIAQLKKQGYELVTVTELLSRDGTPPKAGKTYFNG